MSNTSFHRTNLNLYAEDVAYMQRMFGRGWTEQARDIIHQEVKAIRLRTDHVDTPKPNDETIRHNARLLFKDLLDEFGVEIDEFGVEITRGK